MDSVQGDREPVSDEIYQDEEKRLDRDNNNKQNITDA